MSKFSIQEFKPTIFFLLKFVGFYLVGNLLYGLYVTSYAPQPDPVTNIVSHQSGAILTVLGWPIETEPHSNRAATQLIYDNNAILSVYEGCNGLNVMIIFLSFLLAFGPYKKALIWFLLGGIVLIHLANLARLILLFWVSVYYEHYLYFTHKYIFTGVLFALVFVLWIVWIRKFTSSKS